MDNLNLYFGSPTTGEIHKFGDVTSDNGSSIDSFWKSKDYIGEDPFMDMEFKRFDMIVIQSSGTNITVTYEIDTSTATSFTESLYDATDAILRLSKNIPVGKVGGFLNLKLGDDSSDKPWEVLGLRMAYRLLPWRPSR